MWFRPAWISAALAASLWAAEAGAQEKPKSDLPTEWKPFVDQQQPRSNPLVEIADEMRHVVGEINQLNTAQPTQEKQDQIVSKLDDLIKQLEKE